MQFVLPIPNHTVKDDFKSTLTTVGIYIFYTDQICKCAKEKSTPHHYEIKIIHP